MIPSPTKLALLTGILLVLWEVACHPTKYDERQEGDFNVRADVEDVVLVAVPPKDYISNGMTWFGVNFVRNNHWKNPTRIKARFPSKFGFAPKEKSPYKVDLGKSTVPVIKLRSPATEEATKPRKDKNRAEKEEAEGTEESAAEEETPSNAVTGGDPETTTISENKTVKKELKKEAEKDATPEGGKEKATAAKNQIPKKKNETKSEAPTSSPLVPIGVGMDPDSNIRIENCGPQAHRDGTGKCVYQ